MELIEAQKLWQPEPGWLNTASYGLPPEPAWTALQDALADWRVGRTSWEGWDESTNRCRAAFARLVGGVPVADVAIGSTASQLLAPVAAALPSGATVVVPEVEFTSNLFPWLAQAGRGVQVRTVPLARLVDAIDAGTDLVAFSLVQSADGALARTTRSWPRPRRTARWSWWTPPRPPAGCRSTPPLPTRWSSRRTSG